MNTLKAIVTNIKGKEGLHTVEFDYHGIKLCMMGLELPHILVGSEVLLGVKPTHLSLAKDDVRRITIDNRINAKIVEVKNGEVLSKIVLDSGYDIFESIITLSSSLDMDLKEKDEVLMLVNASELFIKEVL
jgi:molybdopterin-binding protein